MGYGLKLSWQDQDALSSIGGMQDSFEIDGGMQDLNSIRPFVATGEIEMKILKVAG